MKIEICSKNYFIKDTLKELINKKVEKLSRYFKQSAKAKVLCEGSKNGQMKLELTIVDKGIVFKSERTSDNMYENLDIVLPKVERQIIKTFDKIKDKLKKSAQIVQPEFFSDEVVPQKRARVVKSKKLELIPLTQEEAILNLEMIGHAFYLYLSKESGNVHLLYRRNDGEFGEIEGIYDWKN